MAPDGFALPVAATALHLRSLQNDLDSSNNGRDGMGDDPAVFWSVNIFVLVLVSVVFCLCWKFQHSRCLRGHQVSDIVIQMEARRRVEEEKKIVPPEKRMAQLLASFARNNVTMIVLESDLCDEITESPLAQSDAVVREVKATVSVAPVKTITDDRAECAPPRLESKSTSTTTTRSNSTVTETSNELDVEIGIPVLADGDGVVDRVESDEDDNDAEIDPCETGYLMLRSPRLKRPRPVPNCCAVCICPYEKDEVVVWSSNRHCKHAFHLDCMMDWLVKSFDGTPCPCCRQDFTDLVQYRIEQKIKWAPGYAFNPSVVVLRSSSNGRAAAVAAQPQQMTSPI